jgi:hypothetical protein
MLQLIAQKSLNDEFHEMEHRGFGEYRRGQWYFLLVPDEAFPSGRG